MVGSTESSKPINSQNQEAAKSSRWGWLKKITSRSSRGSQPLEASVEVDYQAQADERRKSLKEIGIDMDANLWEELEKFFTKHEMFSDDSIASRDVFLKTKQETDQVIGQLTVDSYLDSQIQDAERMRIHHLWSKERHQKILEEFKQQKRVDPVKLKVQQEGEAYEIKQLNMSTEEMKKNITMKETWDSGEKSLIRRHLQKKMSESLGTLAGEAIGGSDSRLSGSKFEAQNNKRKVSFLTREAENYSKIDHLLKEVEGRDLSLTGKANS